MSVTLSAGVRQNLLSLQKTADMMSQTQNRLATGKKVNSALDNPTNFFTSQNLNSRANELSSLLDGISNATKTLEAADNGIKGITKLVESAQSTARQALQAGGGGAGLSMNEDQRAAIRKQVEAGLRLAGRLEAVAEALLPERHPLKADLFEGKAVLLARLRQLTIGGGRAEEEKGVSAQLAEAERRAADNRRLFPDL